ncbi:MAG: ankyrin repeat domain-containing protein [Deltaproteobacteria bacterium]|nr:ankyrin repeat domain-containing protein [Deltaproteobacteria bacterium]
MEDLTEIAAPMAVFAFIVVVVYAVHVYVSRLFRGFRGLQTQREIDRLVSQSRAIRSLYESYKSRSKGPRKRELVHELMSAAKSGDVVLLKDLVDHGVDADGKRGIGGRTALMRASENGHLGAVEFLVGCGAQVNAKGGRMGRSALLGACGRGHSLVAKALLDHRADVNSKDNWGLSSLALAAVGGYTDLVELLLGSGADPNARDNDGKTPLMLVVPHYSAIPYRAIIQMLVERGADVNISDLSGKTVLDISNGANLSDLTMLLRSYGAESGRRYEEPRTAPPVTRMEKYYFVLDCRPSDSDEEVKRRYHALVKAYHPDAIQGKGLPADFVTYATHKFQEINEAFQGITRYRQGQRE